MRRWSIGRLMLAVVVVAANLGAIRLLLDAPHDDVSTRTLVVGFLPLANTLVVALWLVASRYRLAIRRRARGEAGGFAGCYAAIGTPLVLGLLAASVLSPTSFFDYLVRGWHSIE